MKTKLQRAAHVAWLRMGVLRWLLLPAYVVWRIVTVLRCDFGWHKWHWSSRPVWSDYRARPTSFQHYQVCVWCRTVNLRSEHYHGRYFHGKAGGE